MAYTESELLAGIKDALAAKDERMANALADRLDALRAASGVKPIPTQRDTLGPVGNITKILPESGDAAALAASDKGDRGIGARLRAALTNVPGFDYAAAAVRSIPGVKNIPVLSQFADANPAPGTDFGSALREERLKNRLATENNPDSALAGGAVLYSGVPMPGGQGVGAALRRVGAVAGTAGVTRAAEGADTADVASHAAGAALLPALVEAPGVTRSLSAPLRERATARAWRVLQPDAGGAREVAEQFDPLRIDGSTQAGDWLKRAALADGTPVVGRGDTTAQVAGKMQQLQEAIGQLKSGLVSKADAAGARVDVGSVIAEARKLVDELHSPPYSTIPGAAGKVDELVQNLVRDYGEKHPELIGIARVGDMAHRPIPGQSAVRLPGDEALLTRTPKEIFDAIPRKADGTMNLDSDAGRDAARYFRLKEGNVGTEIEVPPEWRRETPGVTRPPESTVQDTTIPPPPGRLEAGTGRPAAGSGWEPRFAEPPPPKTLQEWEDLKSALQSFVHDTQGLYARPDVAINNNPALQRVNRLAGVIRSADETAAGKALSPEDFAAFLKAKEDYGNAAVLSKLLKQGSVSDSVLKGNPSQAPLGRQLSYFAHRAFPAFAASAAGTGLGLESHSLGAALAGAGAAGLLGKAATRFSEANPSMTRIYESLAQAASRARDMNIDPATAARIALLAGETPSGETP